MKVPQPTLFTALAGLATAMPSKTLKQRSTTSCDQYASATAGPYVIQNNLWGEYSGNGGSQCYTVISVNGNDVAWSSQWSWSGNPDAVKSYSNLLTTVSDTQLSAISSIPTTWQWSYSGSVVADVSYDLFTASSPSGAHVYEIMVWLAALGGAKPIAHGYDANGAIPTVSGLTIGGNSFNLYSGPNGDTTVFSFVATSELEDFTGDINDFIQYLVQNEGVSDSQYLLSVQAGTEAFSGSGTFTTFEYTLAVDA